jgi:hypothetical protein
MDCNAKTATKLDNPKLQSTGKKRSFKEAHKRTSSIGTSNFYPGNAPVFQLDDNN